MDKVKVLNSNMLKVIAFLCMVVDHLYKQRLIPENMVTISIGRIAFPIFAFCIAEGAYYTRDKVRYLMMLFIFAVLSETSFDLMIYGKASMRGQNVLWTFFLAVCAIYLAQFVKDKVGPDGEFWDISFAFLFSLVAMAFLTDYSGAGVMCIAWMYALKNRNSSKASYTISLIWCLIIMNVCIAFTYDNIYQMLGLLAIIPILMYNGEKGSKNILWKMFYAAYPVHMAVIYLIKMIY